MTRIGRTGRSRSVLEDLRPPGGWYTLAASPGAPPGLQEPVEAREVVAAQDTATAGPVTDEPTTGAGRPRRPSLPRVRLARAPVAPAGRERPPASEWLERAACAGLDPGVFFPGRGESTEPAKQVCAGCPVRGECLEHALAKGERFGVWGGLSERERRAIRRQRRARRGTAA